MVQFPSILTRARLLTRSCFVACSGRMARVGSLTRTLKSFGLVLLVAGTVSACSSIYRNHGYVPTEAELSEIAVGQDTQDTVAEKIGRPATTGVERGSQWYYVQSRVETRLYNKPEVIERQVVVVSFNGSGRVSNIERFGLENGAVIALNRRVTDSNIEGVSFLRQLMGNIGRFDAGTVLPD